MPKSAGNALPQIALPDNHLDFAMGIDLKINNRTTLLINGTTLKHAVLIEIMQQLWRNHAFPACTLIPVSGLALNRMLFKVEATAYTF